MQPKARRPNTAHQLELDPSIDALLSPPISSTVTSLGPSSGNTTLAEMILNDPKAWGCDSGRMGTAEFDDYYFGGIGMDMLTPDMITMTSPHPGSSTELISVRPFTRKHQLFPATPSVTSAGTLSSDSSWGDFGDTSPVSIQATLTRMENPQQDPRKISRLSMSFFWSEKNLFRAVPSPGGMSPVTPGGFGRILFPDDIPPTPIRGRTVSNRGSRRYSLAATQVSTGTVKKSHQRHSSIEGLKRISVSTASSPHVDRRSSVPASPLPEILYLVNTKGGSGGRPSPPPGPRHDHRPKLFLDPTKTSGITSVKQQQLPIPSQRDIRSSENHSSLTIDVPLPDALSSSAVPAVGRLLPESSPPPEEPLPPIPSDQPAPHPNDIVRKDSPILNDPTMTQEPHITFPLSQQNPTAEAPRPKVPKSALKRSKVKDLGSDGSSIPSMPVFPRKFLASNHNNGGVHENKGFDDATAGNGLERGRLGSARGRLTPFPVAGSRDPSPNPSGASLAVADDPRTSRPPSPIRSVRFANNNHTHAHTQSEPAAPPPELPTQHHATSSVDTTSVHNRAPSRTDVTVAILKNNSNLPLPPILPPLSHRRNQSLGIISRAGSPSPGLPKHPAERVGLSRETSVTLPELQRKGSLPNRVGESSVANVTPLPSTSFIQEAERNSSKSVLPVPASASSPSGTNAPIGIAITTSSSPHRAGGHPSTSPSIFPRRRRASPNPSPTPPLLALPPSVSPTPSLLSNVSENTNPDSLSPWVAIRLKTRARVVKKGVLVTKQPELVPF